MISYMISYSARFKMSWVAESLAVRLTQADASKLGRRRTTWRVSAQQPWTRTNSRKSRLPAGPARPGARTLSQPEPERPCLSPGGCSLAELITLETTTWSELGTSKTKKYFISSKFKIWLRVCVIISFQLQVEDCHHQQTQIQLIPIIAC
jgi:hypothetical protein